MHTKDEIVRLFYEELAELSQLAQLTESERWSLARELVDACIRFRKRWYLVELKLVDGKVYEVIYYDPKAATSFLRKALVGLAPGFLTGGLSNMEVAKTAGGLMPCDFRFLQEVTDIFHGFE